MRFEGREIVVDGSLLRPLTRRTTDILRVLLACLGVAAVIAGSVITRSEWDALERSVSDIVGVLSPDQSNIVYLIYGIAILALPVGVLVGLVLARRWKLLAGCIAAATAAVLSLSISVKGFSGPAWHIDSSTRLDTLPSQFLDDPRWIALLAAIVTVAGPGLSPPWRRAWVALLVAFVPIHLVVSTVVPARSLLGMTVGFLAGALIRWVVGTPALEVPLRDTVRVLASRGFTVTAFRVVAPAGRGPLVLVATIDGHTPPEVVVELYSADQRSGGVLRQFVRVLRFRSSESAPLHSSLRRAVEHRALMTIALGQVEVAASRILALEALDRGWVLCVRTGVRGRPLDAERGEDARAVWGTLDRMRRAQLTHGDLRAQAITVDDGVALMDCSAYAELGASGAQRQSDVADLLLTTSSIYGEKSAVQAAIDVLGEDVVLDGSRRLTKPAISPAVRKSVADADSRIKSTRREVLDRTGTASIPVAQVTRFTRRQIFQLVLLIALVYVAYPFVSSVPAFVTELGNAKWWWALAGLLISATTYFGAAAALWACASGLVRYRDVVLMQVANTFAATTTPAGVGGLALSVRFLQKGGLTVPRATAAVALQQSMQVIVHVGLLVFFSVVAGTSTQLSHFVPSSSVLLLAGGALLGVIGTFTFVPTLRRWLATAVRPQLAEVLRDLVDLAKNPKKFSLIVLGCASTTLGASAALWVSIEAFGGDTTFVTVTVVTMIGGTLASAAPTPGGVGAVEAALIGGLVAFGLGTAVAVPAVLLYRVLTCWIPVFIGWPILRWMTRADMI